MFGFGNKESITPESGHATATLNGKTLASTTTWQRCDGNVYFPPGSLAESQKGEVFRNTELMTYCPWKGHAGYYAAIVDGKMIEDVAWFYADPYDKAMPLKDHVAFDKSKVKISVE